MVDRNIFIIYMYVVVCTIKMEQQAERRTKLKRAETKDLKIQSLPLQIKSISPSLPPYLSPPCLAPYQNISSFLSLSLSFIRSLKNNSGSITREERRSLTG